MKRYLTSFLLLAAALLLFCGCNREEEHSTTIRIGGFPNVTHVQSLVARHMTRNGEGWFERYLPGYNIEWYTYNAGPTAMEAIFGRTVDLTYVGPSPALNAYAVAAGREVRLLAGAVNGGAALMVAPDSGITNAADFKGRSIATPQLGNTQDVSCRAWLNRNGLSCSLEGGGDCRVSPTPNAMQLQLMKQGDIAACWTVEPWVSSLEMMAGARPLVQEPDVVTTVLVGRVGWLQRHPKEAALILQAHRELTQWIVEHPEEAQQMVVAELTELTQAPCDPEIVRRAWPRLTLTTEVDKQNLEQFVSDARNCGLLDRVPPLEDMLYKPENEQP
ncbi:MAG: ABC transporter substrate-binding protein [Akkermansia sp.]|nr:ABC transporter substrate-binding protein [Akkermansia sp.]